MRTDVSDGTLLVRSSYASCLFWFFAIGGGAAAVGAAILFSTSEPWRLLAVAGSIGSGIWLFSRLSSTWVAVERGGIRVRQFSGREQLVGFDALDRVAAGPFPLLRLTDGESITLWSVIDDGDLEAVVEAIERARLGNAATPSSHVEHTVHDKVRQLRRDQRRLKFVVIAAVVTSYIVRLAMENS